MKMELLSSRANQVWRLSRTTRAYPAKACLYSTMGVLPKFLSRSFRTESGSLSDVVLILCNRQIKDTYFPNISTRKENTSLIRARTKYFINSVHYLSRTNLRYYSTCTYGSQFSTMDRKSLDANSNKEIKDARAIFDAAVSSVMPVNMINERLHFDESIKTLEIDGHQFVLDNNLYVVGFGKAVMGMAAAVEAIVGPHIKAGVISVPVGMSESLIQADKREMLLSSGSLIRVMEGAKGNMPDAAAMEAAKEIQNVLEGLVDDDLLIVLISGGGSALLPLPETPLTLQHLSAVTREMSRAGASIQQINKVRRQLEILKGGGIILKSKPAQVISLIISDVIGDPLDLIASGPTVPNNTTPSECLEIFESLGVSGSIPQPVTQFLNTFQQFGGIRHEIRMSQHVNISDSFMEPEPNRVFNFLIGSNKIACEKAMEESITRGYSPFLLSNTLDGEARVIGKMFAQLASYIISLFQEHSINGLNLKEFPLLESKLDDLKKMIHKAFHDKKNICVIAGGETTVTVHGQGTGGRNQEMVLAAALEMHEMFHNKNPHLLTQTFHPKSVLQSAPSKDGAGVSGVSGFPIRTNESISTRSKKSTEHNAIDSDSSEVALYASPRSSIFSQQTFPSFECTAYYTGLGFLSAGTDGQDGPTSSAGAVIDENFAFRVEDAGLNAVDYLTRNDSHSLFSNVNQGANLVSTGLTGTNVMDIQVLLIKLF